MPCAPLFSGFLLHICINLQFPVRPLYSWSIARRLSWGGSFSSFSLKSFQREESPKIIRMAKDSIFLEHLSGSSFVNVIIIIYSTKFKAFHWSIMSV